MENQTTLIIGANSDIAKAIALNSINKPENKLIVVTRKGDFYQDEKFQGTNVILVDDYLEESIQVAVEMIFLDLVTPITRVFICHGLLLLLVLF